MMQWIAHFQFWIGDYVTFSRIWFLMLGYRMIQTVFFLFLGLTLWIAIQLFFATIIDYFLYLFGIADDHPCHDFVVYAGDPPYPDPGTQGRQPLPSMSSRQGWIFLTMVCYASGYVSTAGMAGHDVINIHHIGPLFVFIVPAGNFVGTVIHKILVQESKWLQRMSWHEKPAWLLKDAAHSE